MNWHVLDYHRRIPDDYPRHERMVVSTDIQHHDTTRNEGLHAQKGIVYDEMWLDQHICDAPHDIPFARGRGAVMASLLWEFSGFLLLVVI